VAHHLERLLKLENETEHLADPTATVIAPIFDLAVEVLSTIAELVCQWGSLKNNSRVSHHNNACMDTGASRGT